jgi:hypothetical protein
MAHSIQTHNGKTAVINDVDLLIIIGFALRFLRNKTEFAKLRSLAAQWQESLLQYGPGIIDLKIDTLSQTPETIRELMDLLNKVVERVEKFHGTIPADVLNLQLSVPGVTFCDCKVSSIKEAVMSIRALVSTD